MSNQPIDKRSLTDALLKGSGGRIDRGSIESAMNGNADALLNKLDNSERDKIRKLLSDRSALQKLMSSDAAQQIINKISKNGK